MRWSLEVLSTHFRIYGATNLLFQIEKGLYTDVRSADLVLGFACFETSPSLISAVKFFLGGSEGKHSMRMLFALNSQNKWPSKARNLWHYNWETREVLGGCSR